jgi:hypothetical protein
VQIRAGSRVRSGSPGSYRLRALPTFTETVAAARALARRHLPLKTAKAAVENLLASQEVTVTIPKIEDPLTFEQELAGLGIEAAPSDQDLKRAAGN